MRPKSKTSSPFHNHAPPTFLDGTPFPDIRGLGLSRERGDALRRILYLYREVEDDLSYHTLKECAKKLSTIEALVQRYFAQDWDRLMAKKAARDLVMGAVRAGLAATAETPVEEEVLEESLSP